MEEFLHSSSLRHTVRVYPDQTLPRSNAKRSTRGTTPHEAHNHLPKGSRGGSHEEVIRQLQCKGVLDGQRLVVQQPVHRHHVLVCVRGRRQAHGVGDGRISKARPTTTWQQNEIRSISRRKWSSRLRRERGRSRGHPEVNEFRQLPPSDTLCPGGVRD